MSKDLAIAVIIAAADLMVLVAMGAPESEWLPVLERFAECKSAFDTALVAENARGCDAL